MLTNTLLKLWQSAFLDCFPDKMLAEHSLFTSAVLIPFEGHMTASCYIICEIHCTNLDTLALRIHGFPRLLSNDTNYINPHGA